MTKKYQICHHQIRFFFQAQNVPKSVFRPGLRPGPRWGSSRRSPRPLVGWIGLDWIEHGLTSPPTQYGEMVPPPHSPPNSTPSASRNRRIRRLSSQAPLNTWLRQWLMIRISAQWRTQQARAPTETSQQIFTDYEKCETCSANRKVKSIGLTGSVILSSCSCHERL